MNIKFGMPTLIEKDNIVDNVLLCKELGLSFVELNMNLPYCMPENISSKELLAIKEKYGVQVIDPAFLSVAYAEVCARLNIVHSRNAYSRHKIGDKNVL